MKPSSRTLFDCYDLVLIFLAMERAKFDDSLYFDVINYLPTKFNTIATWPDGYDQFLTIAVQSAKARLKQAMRHRRDHVKFAIKNKYFLGEVSDDDFEWAFHTLQGHRQKSLFSILQR